MTVGLEERIRNYQTRLAADTGSWRTGYKLFQTDKRHPGKLFTLYINADQPLEMQKWLPAEVGPMKDETHVATTRGLGGKAALRPGWHLNETAPYVKHIYTADKQDKNVHYLQDGCVWAEVQYKTNVDYSDAAALEGINRKGVVVPKNAQLRVVPKNGFYRYKTNANQPEPWIIAGDIRIVRVLDDAEVASLCEKAGYTDYLKRNPEKPMDFEQFAGCQRQRLSKDVSAVDSGR